MAVGAVPARRLCSTEILLEAPPWAGAAWSRSQVVPRLERGRPTLRKPLQELPCAGLRPQHQARLPLPR